MQGKMDACQSPSDKGSRWACSLFFLKTRSIYDNSENSSIYVNGAYRDASPIGKLMHDFFCTDPGDMHYDELAERVRFFKESKEGVTSMCKAMDDLREKSREEGKKEGKLEEREQTALRMLEKKKYALEEIAEMTELPLDEIKKLQGARTLKF